jgi:hypothetical protein
MMQSYLGIITGRGLQSLFLESDHILRILAHVAYAEQPARAVCYWAAMQVPEAIEVQEQLDEGDNDRALQVLRASAKSLGPILPSDVRHLRLS